MAYHTGWDDVDDRADAPPRGGRGLLSSALWGAGALGLIVTVVGWTYALGARDADRVAALSVGGDGPAIGAPEASGGAVTPGADSAAYDVLGPSASAPGDDLLLGAPAERATAEDVAAARDRAALAAGSPVSGDVFFEIVNDALETPDPSSRRDIDLDPVAPRPGGGVEIAGAREDLPPNVGDGAEELPPDPASFITEPTDAPPDAAAAALDAASAPLGEAPPEAEAPPAAAASAAPAAAPAPTPRTEPAEAEQVVVAAAEPVAAEPTSAPPAAVGPAMFQVQLAALNSVDEVERRWEQVRADHADLVGALTLDIQEMNIDNLQLYRLRIGDFTSREEASALCRRLTERGVDCFPATK